MARPGALGAPSRGRCGAALAQGGRARFDPGDVPPPPTTDGPMCGSVLFIMKEHSCDDGGEARTAWRGRTQRRATEAAAHAAHAVLWGVGAAGAFGGTRRHRGGRMGRGSARVDGRFHAVAVSCSVRKSCTM